MDQMTFQQNQENVTQPGKYSASTNNILDIILLLKL